MGFFSYFMRPRRAVVSPPQPAVAEVERDFPYQMGSVRIKLPPGHRLPDYQRGNPRYDRFLPVLASVMPHNSLVIDVGANVGDTYASMVVENPGLAFVCVEPDESFFSLMEENVHSVLGQLPVHVPPPMLLNKFVGEGEVKGTLVKRDGSATLVETDVGAIQRYITLDEILAMKAGQGHFSHILIKSDVDGFDHQVIHSFNRHLDQPVLWFFEAQTNERNQREAFAKAIDRLSEKLGCEFAVFDNFGALMCRDVSAKVVKSLLDYVDRQNIGADTRTIWYLDVLAYSVECVALANDALERYQAGIVSKPYAAAPV